MKEQKIYLISISLSLNNLKSCFFCMDATVLNL